MAMLLNNGLNLIKPLMLVAKRVRLRRGKNEHKKFDIMSRWDEEDVKFNKSLDWVQQAMI